MSNRIYLKSTEHLVDGQGFARLDGAVVLAVDKLSDGSLAHNVYTRLGDQVYEDTSFYGLEDALKGFRDIRNSLASLQVALRNCDLYSPVPAKPKPYVPDYTKAEPEVRDLGGRVFPGHFQWYLMVSHGVLEGFPIAGYASLQRALDQAAELQDIEDPGDCHYVVEV